MFDLPKALELARKAGATANVGWILGSLGDNAAIAGSMADAEAFEREAIEQALAVGSEPLLAMRVARGTHVRARGSPPP